VSEVPIEIEFLTVEVVIALHQRQLDRIGGGVGLRDRGLLESAIAQPQASFGGTFAHDGLFAMAAAYLFHIVSNPSSTATSARGCSQRRSFST
jgi:death-on-curing protein